MYGDKGNICGFLHNISASAGSCTLNTFSRTVAVPLQYSTVQLVQNRSSLTTRDHERCLKPKCKQFPALEVQESRIGESSCIADGLGGFELFLVVEQLLSAVASKLSLGIFA